MERIPEQWESLRAKAGAEEVPSLLNLIWYPGYESLYQAFLERVRAKIRGYTVGSRELLVVPGVSPYSPTATLQPSVWSSALSVKEQVQLAFSQIIQANKGASEAELARRLQMSWVLLEGRRLSEIDERLRALARVIHGWYAVFFRRYFFFSVPAFTVIFGIWKKLVKPAIGFYWRSLLFNFQLKHPETAAMIGHYVMGPAALLWKTWFGLAYIPALVKGFALSGIAIGGMALAIGLPGIAVLVAVVGFLLLMFLPGYTAHAPAHFTPEEIDALYANPALQPLRTEIANIAIEVKEIEAEIEKLKSIPFSQATLGAIDTRIEKLRLEVGDDLLNPVRAKLRERLAELRETTAVSSSVLHAENVPELSDAVLEAYYDQGAILEILAPYIQKEVGDRRSLDDNEIEGVLERAAAAASKELDAYAGRLADKIFEEQEVLAVADTQALVLEAGIEAARRLEELVSLEIVDRSEYEIVAQQLEVVAAEIDPEGQELAGELLSAVNEVLGGLS